MVTISNLGLLSSQKIKDATTLLKHGRNSGASYLMGYALEYSFKSKIAKTLKFSRGFPDTKPDFNSYSREIASFNCIRLFYFSELAFSWHVGIKCLFSPSF